ncbi:SH3 domain-containing protein [Apiospora kogelbergensis]|uniref:SH3 domain-containing protein n=1 Tax=Apiospora kogelbergensis TaxID=1337665 RepID=UPI00312E63C8
MASLNLSINGASIKSSYQGVINAPAPPAGSSSTYGQWALFSVQAPLANAFQDSGNKESVLKVQTKGEGELDELIEDFNEGRVQFAFLKIKDPNSGLPKYALIAWCGGGVPERTKGYFTSHLNAVSKVLHGYHVQITARSDTDLEPANILQKIADASGSKYTAGGSAPVKPAGGPPPPVKSKPVFPTSATGTISFNPIVAARNAQLRQNTNDDGWGEDAPQVSRTNLEKVESAYKPTKVNMAELTSQKQEPPRGASSQEDDRPGVVRGAYQPVGKVDIAAIRAAAKEKTDDRPTTVKGAYEPVGKVDIAAIRARAQKPADEEAPEQPKPVAERSAAFSQPPASERITEMPKPKVANKFGGASSFTGTKPLNPGGFGLLGPTATGSSGGQLGAAGRKFADSAGKTPAQLWAEKKAAQGGGAPSPAPASSGAANPISPQASGQAGGWKSGYSGKSWAPVQPPAFSRGIAGQKTGETATSQEEQQAPSSPSGGAAPIGAAAGVGAAAGIGAGAAAYAATRDDEEEESGPPPPPMGNRPNEDAPTGGFALPGMPPRPPPVTDEEEEEEQEPIQVAMPVARGPEPELEPAHEPPRSLPTRPIEQELPREEDLPAEEEEQDPRASAAAVAQEQFGQDAVTDVQGATSGGRRALIQYDYEKAEDNELELREGEYVTNIEMVDEDWWMGTNSTGESGLFPSNYVELVDDEEEQAPEAPAASMPPPPLPQLLSPSLRQPRLVVPDQLPLPSSTTRPPRITLSFPEGATVTNLEFPDDDWWFGHYNGDTGLFPANYVELDQ